MSKIGFYAEQAPLKVTQAPKVFERMVKVPCQMGFKNGDTWTNEWVDVLLTKDLMKFADGIEKGDKLNVWGRMELTTYKDKKSWNIWASEIEMREKKETKDVPDNVPEQPPLQDVPF